MLRGRNLTIFSLSCKSSGEELTIFRKSKVVQSSKLFTGTGIGLIDSKALRGTVCLNHSILQVFSGLIKLIAFELPLMLLLTLWPVVSQRWMNIIFSFRHGLSLITILYNPSNSFCQRLSYINSKVEEFTIFLPIKQVHSFSDILLLF